MRNNVNPQWLLVTSLPIVAVSPGLRRQEWCFDACEYCLDAPSTIPAGSHVRSGPTTAPGRRAFIERP